MAQEYTTGFSEMKNIYLGTIVPNTLRQEMIQEEVEARYALEERLDPVGQEDADVNNDEKIDNSDKYIKRKRRAISTAIRKRQLRKEALEQAVTGNTYYAAPDDFIPEGYDRYDWRSTMSEDIQRVIDDLEADQIDVKPVNNYAKNRKGGKPVVTINPNINLGEAVEELGGVVIDLSEDVDFVNESIEIATEYFYNEGLDETDIEDLIEDYGVEEFTEMILEMGYDALCEWRRGPDGTKIRGTQMSKSGKHMSTLKGGAKASAIRGTAEHKARKAEKSAESTPSGMTAALKSQARSAKVSKEQKPAAKSGLMGRIQAAVQAGMERDRMARETAGKAVSAARRFGSEVRSPFENTKAGRNLQAALIKGARNVTRTARDEVAREVARRRVLKNEFEGWVNDLLDEGYDLSDWTWDELYEEYEDLQEKAVSEQQQKIFGLALSVKRGETPRSKVSKQVLDMVDSMPEGELRKFAKTKHSGIPKRVEK